LRQSEESLASGVPAIGRLGRARTLLRTATPPRKSLAAFCRSALTASVGSSWNGLAECRPYIIMEDGQTVYTNYADTRFVRMRLSTYS
jgi:hypothetical protein